MSTGDRKPWVKQMVAVFRAPSAIVINEGDEVRARTPLETGDLVTSFRTRYLNKGHKHSLPGDLWIEGRGPADSIEEAVRVFGGAAANILAVIAFATNAAVHDMEPELVFDNTPGVTTRDFLQSYLPDERAVVSVGRALDKTSLIALMEAIEKHHERERIGRALAQYRLALNHWRWGHEIMATAHLYIGMEVLTVAAIRSRLRVEGISETEFAQRLGIEEEKSSKSAVEVATRRQILFRGDDECYTDAKAASDGLEHGFMPFDRIREHAARVRDRTAAYLREAIVELLELDDAAQAKLLSPPRTEPLGRWPIVKYVRGKLLGDGPELAQGANEYPIMAWRSDITSVTAEDNGNRRIEFNEVLSPQLGDGITFQAQSFQVWQP